MVVVSGVPLPGVTVKLSVLSAAGLVPSPVMLMFPPLASAVPRVKMTVSAALTALTTATLLTSTSMADPPLAV